MELREQISNWSITGRFDLIIETIQKMPKHEKDYSILCQLAFAYNNSNRFQDSIDLLLWLSN
jgi:hypothetical protein